MGMGILVGKLPLYTALGGLRPSAGSNLDSNAKMWRLVADFMNNLGMLLDLVSPSFPSAFIVIVCLGSLLRSFSRNIIASLVIIAPGLRSLTRTSSVREKISLHCSQLFS